MKDSGIGEIHTWGSVEVRYSVSRRALCWTGIMQRGRICFYNRNCSGESKQVREISVICRLSAVVRIRRLSRSMIITCVWSTRHRKAFISRLRILSRMRRSWMPWWSRWSPGSKWTLWSHVCQITRLSIGPPILILAIWSWPGPTVIPITTVFYTARAWSWMTEYCVTEQRTWTSAALRWILR